MINGQVQVQAPVFRLHPLNSLAYPSAAKQTVWQIQILKIRFRAQHSANVDQDLYCSLADRKNLIFSLYLCESALTVTSQSFAYWRIFPPYSGHISIFLLY